MTKDPHPSEAFAMSLLHPLIGNIKQPKFFPPDGYWERGLIPAEAVTAFNGDTGAGKTTFLMSLMAACRDGQDYIRNRGRLPTPSFALAKPQLAQFHRAREEATVSSSPTTRAPQTSQSRRPPGSARMKQQPSPILSSDGESRR